LKLFDHGKRTSNHNLLKLTSVLLLCLILTVNCVTDQDGIDADQILASIGNAEGDILATVEGNIIVYSSDLGTLKADLEGKSDSDTELDVVLKYIKSRDRVDCIIEKIDEANTENMSISCSGMVVVETKDMHGIEGMSKLLSSMPNQDKTSGDTRHLLMEYLYRWSNAKKITRVQDSLEQMERSRNIPLFGSVVEKIHKFPILYEGKELIAADETDALLMRIKSMPDDERRLLVENHLRETNILN
jgi:hypothetical protein